MSLKEVCLIKDTQKFVDHGFLKISKFYDQTSEIEPIKMGIYQIIGQVMKRHGIRDERNGYENMDFDRQFMELVRVDRAYGSEVYDLVKQIPAFRRLTALKKNEELYKIIYPDAILGFATHGDGIRINFPRENKYRAEWHQEYPTQLRSPSGIVYWTPLVNVNKSLGPVKICDKSHKAGMLPIDTVDSQNPNKTGAYAYRLKNEKSIVQQYKIIEPLCEPGDLLILDYATIHCSGFNVSEKPLWSVQFRYFNFDNLEGRRIGWRGPSRN